MKTMEPVLPEPRTALEDWYRSVNRLQTELAFILSSARKIEVRYE